MTAQITGSYHKSIKLRMELHPRSHIFIWWFSFLFPSIFQERDVAQSIVCPPLKRSVVGSILLSGPSCSLGYFPFQPVVYNWFIKGRGMYCSVYGKVHIKDPLLLIEKSSLCGSSGFPSKKVCQRDHMNDVQ